MRLTTLATFELTDLVTGQLQGFEKAQLDVTNSVRTEVEVFGFLLALASEVSANSSLRGRASATHGASGTGASKHRAWERQSGVERTACPESEDECVHI